MATKAIRGSRASIFINGYNVSAYLSENESETESEELTFTPFESDEAEVVSGSKTTTLTLTGAWNGDVGSLDELLDNGYESDSEFAILRCPGGVASTGKAAYLHPGALINNNESAASDEIAELEAEFKTRKSRARILQGPTVISATGTGTALVHTAATNFGAKAQLHVIDVTGTPTSVVILVQHSADGTTWATLMTFATVTVANQFEHLETLATTTVNAQVRVQHTITGGTTPTIRYVCAFHRALA